MNINDYMTTQEAAQLLGYDDSHVRRLILMGKLTAIKWGKKQWMIPSGEVDLLAKQRKQIKYQRESKGH